jgi:YVTN family beta-propeller protein
MNAQVPRLLSVGALLISILGCSQRTPQQQNTTSPKPFTPPSHSYKIDDEDGQTPGTINKVAAIDAASGKVVAQYDAGTDPEQFAISAVGRRLFISNEDAGTASIVDTESGKILSTVIVGIEPEGVTISPELKKLPSA